MNIKTSFWDLGKLVIGQQMEDEFAMQCRENSFVYIYDFSYFLIRRGRIASLALLALIEKDIIFSSFPPFVQRSVQLFLCRRRRI